MVGTWLNERPLPNLNVWQPQMRLNPFRPRERKRPRWPALLVVGLALQAVAGEHERPPRGNDYFTTHPADIPPNLQGGWPYIPAEYTPPPEASAGKTLSRDPSPPRPGVEPLRIACARAENGPGGTLQRKTQAAR